MASLCWTPPCSTRAAATDAACGCGPDLQWCSLNVEEDRIAQAMSEAIDHRVRDMVRHDKPYLELLNGRTGFVNGPLVHFYTHHTQVPNAVRIDQPPLRAEELPSLAFTDTETWLPISLPEGHSGVLTAEAFLLRFQTNRGRANRFFTEFLCGEFLPPESGIMEIAEENPTPDLSQKPVCMDCHTVLEPWAAYWGRWQEVGANHYDEDAYPTYNDECAECAPYCQDTYCRRNYLTRVRHPHEEDYVGTFNPYVFLVGDAEDHPTLGPALWAQEIADDGRLARCAAEKAAIWLLGTPEADIDPALIDGFAKDFAASGLRYRALVRSIVISPVYGRAK